MEKFTVDLDRVLDEFEYNEDCGEQTAGCEKKNYESLSSDFINKYTQDEIPVKVNRNMCEVADTKEISRNLFTINKLQVDPSGLSSNFGEKVEPYETKLKDFIDCNSVRCSKFLNDGTTKECDNNSILHCKSNVTGVFSCLNEYINTGSKSLYIEPANDFLEKESESADVGFTERKSQESNRLFGEHDSPSWTPDSGISCGKESVSRMNFSQQSDICSSPTDSEGGFTNNNANVVKDVHTNATDFDSSINCNTSPCCVASNFYLQESEKEEDSCRENSSLCIAVEQNVSDFPGLVRSKKVPSNADSQNVSSQEEKDQKIHVTDIQNKPLDGKRESKMNSVISADCQEINRNVEVKMTYSEVPEISSCEQAVEMNCSEILENYFTDRPESSTIPIVEDCIIDGKNESAIKVKHEKSGDGIDSDCGDKRRTTKNGASVCPGTSSVQPQSSVDDASKIDPACTSNEIPDEIETVEYRVTSPASDEDAVFSSPDASETSSIEVAIQQCPITNTSNISNETQVIPEGQSKLGRVPPTWIPDDQAPSCMLCFCRFTVLKRRHHCRACGKVFCSKCCRLKFRLEYLVGTEVRVCQLCHDILVRDTEGKCPPESSDPPSPNMNTTSTSLGRRPNPNNPMEYCSTIPPLEQAANVLLQPTPSVLVPVGVLKREGSTRMKSDVTKQVMFSDGIRPGGDLTELDTSPEKQVFRKTDLSSKQMGTGTGMPYITARSRSFDPKTSFISADGIPPLAVMDKGQLKLEDIPFVETVKFLSELRSETSPPAVFALNQNLFVQLKILNLDCCVNRTCWCFSTIGMCCVGQDEIVIILEYLPTDTSVPKDIFHFLHSLYDDASKGNLVNEMDHSTFKTSMFLGSAEHGGFLYIRPSFQCLHKIILPSAPYLVGILIHRWEIPWAKLFPIRLMLRLGAEFRYYPCMLVSVQRREPVYCEIGHTIMNLLADFRNMSYTLPSVRGLVIHMEDRHTSVLLPKNRYDQVARALNNSNDHVLALAANFSIDADSHLVCIQSPTDDSYHTQAINIHNKPRKVTGASFVVFNGALKISSNLMAKSTIVEDGLMVQITPDTIQQLRASLHKMKDFIIQCGPTSAASPDEIVDIRWVEDDHNFNIGVQSVIDGMALDGVPSIRVHNGSDFLGKTRLIRWTEVFILQPGSISDGLMGANDAVDVSRVAENLATAACMALCDFLDLLAQGGFTRIGVRASIHQDNVEYAVGSQGEKLPPIYMKTLDNTLVPVLHHTATVISNSSPVVLELLFHIMLQ